MTSELERLGAELASALRAETEAEDALKRASARVDRLTRKIRAGGPETWLMLDLEEEWETGHAPVVIQLFKVLRDQGKSTGLTRAEANAAVRERFYDGRIPPGFAQKYHHAWSRGLGMVSTSSDPVMVNVRGERWTVDEGALEKLAPVGALA